MEKNVDIIGLIKKSKPDKIYNSSDLFITKSNNIIDGLEEKIKEGNIDYFNKKNLREAFLVLSTIEGKIDSKIKTGILDYNELENLSQRVKKVKHEVVESLFNINLRDVEEIQRKKHR